jgi:hypothetical protein
MPYGNINVDTVTTSTTGGILGAGNASMLKNRLINGDMRIDQRNAGASVTPTSGQYLLDRWVAVLTQASKFTVQQNAGSVTPPVGFSNYLGCTSSSAYSVGSGDTFLIAQYVEGFNTSDLNWGTANAKTVTLSFQVYSSLTGTFGGAIVNNANNRSYPFSYTVSSANTWTSISLTIAGDTSGTWVGATNGVGMRIRFGLGSGATYSGTAGAWAAGDYVQPTGTVSVVGTNGATFYITGVQLEVGSSATGFEYVNYQTSLANCQRYYQQVAGPNNYRVFGQFYNTTAGRVFCPAYVPFRAAPSITVTTLTGQAIGSGATTFTSTASLVLNIDAVSFDLTGAGTARTAYQSLVFDGLLAMSAEL